MACIQEIVYGGKDDDPTEQDNAPIHSTCHHRGRQGEERENEDRQQEHQSTNVDCIAVATECPATRWEWFPTDAFH